MLSQLPYDLQDYIGKYNEPHCITTPFGEIENFFRTTLYYELAPLRHLSETDLDKIDDLLQIEFKKLGISKPRSVKNAIQGCPSSWQLWIMEDFNCEQWIDKVMDANFFINVIQNEFCVGEDMYDNRETKYYYYSRIYPLNNRYNIQFETDLFDSTGKESKRLLPLEYLI